MMTLINKKSSALSALLFCGGVMMAMPGLAQETPSATVEVSALPAEVDTTVPEQSYATSIGYAEMMAIADAKRFVRDATVTPENVPSLLFTAWQHALLQEAKIGFTTRAPDPGSVDHDTGQPGAPGLREIALGGIAYTGANKWTVWLNKVRITPDAIPEEVLDIKVSRSHVDIKWFDRYTNKIFPIRLRPQERFNLDTRIFLPGDGT
jgi:hypothetical protein